MVAFVAWGTGSGKKQKSIKRTMKLALSGKAHKALFAKENKVTRWLGKYKRGAWWLSVVVGLALFMILPISVGSLVWLLLGVFFVILLIELSAAPK